MLPATGVLIAMLVVVSLRIVLLAVFVLPAASVAVAEIVTMPSARLVRFVAEIDQAPEPSAVASVVTVCGVGVALSVNVTTIVSPAPAVPLTMTAPSCEAFTVLLASGVLIATLVVVSLRMVLVCVAWLPAASVAVAEIVTIPSARLARSAGEIDQFPEPFAVASLITVFGVGVVLSVKVTTIVSLGPAVPLTLTASSCEAFTVLPAIGVPITMLVVVALRMVSLRVAWLPVASVLVTRIVTVPSARLVRSAGEIDQAPEPFAVASVITVCGVGVAYR